MPSPKNGGLETQANRSLGDRMLGRFFSILIYVFERVPIDSGIAFGANFGRLWSFVGGPRTSRVRDQLKASFPEVSVEARNAWARDVFTQLGRGLIELLMLGGRQRAKLLERVEVDGLEHVEAAERLTPSGGVLIVTAHIGNWELACAKVAEIGIPISVVYRDRGQPALNQLMLELRGAGSVLSDGKATVEQIPMGRAGLPVVRALESGRKVLVLLDQNARREEGVFVSFFGRSASTRSGPLDLASFRGIPILPAFIHRKSDGRTHRLKIHPPLQLEHGDSDDNGTLRRNVQRVTDVIEKEIRRSPSQWIWTHSRWRTQPRGTECDPSVE